MKMTADKAFELTLHSVDEYFQTNVLPLIEEAAKNRLVHLQLNYMNGGEFLIDLLVKKGYKAYYQGGYINISWRKI
jgi:hypothetical protein